MSAAIPTSLIITIFFVITEPEGRAPELTPGPMPSVLSVPGRVQGSVHPPGWCAQTQAHKHTHRPGRLSPGVPSTKPSCLAGRDENVDEREGSEGTNSLHSPLSVGQAVLSWRPRLTVAGSPEPPPQWDVCGGHRGYRMAEPKCCGHPAAHVETQPPCVHLGVYSRHSRCPSICLA